MSENVDTVEEVNRCHEKFVSGADKWQLTGTRRPVERHGTYSCKLWDIEGNCWDILSDPPRGYSWILEPGDLEGRGHFETGVHKTRPDIAGD